MGPSGGLSEELAAWCLAFRSCSTEWFLWLHWWNTDLMPCGPLSDYVGPCTGSFQAAVEVTNRKCTLYHSPDHLPGAVNSLAACFLLSSGLDKDLLTVSESHCHCSVTESHCLSIRRDLRSRTWDFCPPGTRPFLDPCAGCLSLAPSPSHILPHSPLCHSGAGSLQTTFPRWLASCHQFSLWEALARDRKAQAERNHHFSS